MCTDKVSEPRATMQVRALDSLEPLRALKLRYLEETTAPLDGMWLTGFVPLARHFGFYEGDELVGYCCVNDEGYLLQLYTERRCRNQSSRFLRALLASDTPPTGKLKGAFVSTAEPDYLSVCFDCFSAFEVNALMYQLDRWAPQPAWLAQDHVVALRPVESSELAEVVAFQVDSIGAPVDWLRGYSSNLIRRQELYGVWEGDRMIAIGESRGYDEYQTGYADLGVIVGPSQRGKGLATNILKQLVAQNERNGLESICSTESSNVGAQKAIARAGFLARNRIVRFDAEPTP